MSLKKLMVIAILFISSMLSASSNYNLERLYVLNHSDYLFTEFKKDIFFSKRYRGRYYKVFPFKKLKFAEYYLKENETIYDLSTRLGISIDSIATASGLVFFYSIKKGQRLIVPNFDGIIYKTDHGCSLSYISKKYNVSVKDIKRFNKYYHNYLPKNKWIFIPGASMMPLEQALFYGTAFANPLPRGRLSSKFGFRKNPINGVYAFHGGIDIAAPYNTIVSASHRGKVEYAGWAGGYGKLVVIKHAFGYRTFYGHLNKIMVRKGMIVDIGKIIGKVGSTGYSTGPHLHFEIRHYNRKLNPQKYASLHHRSRSPIIF